MPNLVDQTLKILGEEPVFTRECMTPGGNGEGKMKVDKGDDTGHKKGRQPADTGKTGQTKPSELPRS